MNKTWNEEELRKVSEHMKRCGWMTYEEFCEWLKDQSKEDEEES